MKLTVNENVMKTQFFLIPIAKQGLNLNNPLTPSGQTQTLPLDASTGLSVLHPNKYFNSIQPREISPFLTLPLYFRPFLLRKDYYFYHVYPVALLLLES
jgi:hypothetical protein